MTVSVISIGIRSILYGVQWLLLFYHRNFNTKNKSPTANVYDKSQKGWQRKNWDTKFQYTTVWINSLLLGLHCFVISVEFPWNSENLEQKRDKESRKKKWFWNNLQYFPLPLLLGCCWHFRNRTLSAPEVNINFYYLCHSLFVFALSFSFFFFFFALLYSFLRPRISIGKFLGFDCMPCLTVILISRSSTKWNASNTELLEVGRE